MIKYKGYKIFEPKGTISKEDRLRIAKAKKELDERRKDELTGTA